MPTVCTTYLYLYPSKRLVRVLPRFDSILKNEYVYPSIQADLPITCLPLPRSSRQCRSVLVFRMGIEIPEPNLHLGGAHENGNQLFDARRRLFDDVRLDEFCMESHIRLALLFRYRQDPCERKKEKKAKCKRQKKNRGFRAPEKKRKSTSKVTPKKGSAETRETREGKKNAPLPTLTASL